MQSVFINFHEYTRCSLFGLIATDTVMLPQILSKTANVYKHAAKNITQQMHYFLTNPETTVFICDLFFKNYVFNKDQWAKTG